MALIPVRQNVTANNPTDIGAGPWRFFKVIALPAGANVTFQAISDQGQAEALRMEVNNFYRTTGKPYLGLRVLSDASGDVDIVWSEEDELRSDLQGLQLSGPLDVTVINQPEVEGPDPYGTQDLLAVLGNPFPGAMLKDNLDLTFTVQPLKTLTNDGLMVERRNYVDGFLSSPDAGIQRDVRIFRTVRVSFIGGTKSILQPLIIGQPDGTPTVPVFKEDGTYVGMGSIPAVGTEDTYLLSVGGHETITITSADPLWNFGLAFCPEYIIP